MGKNMKVFGSIIGVLVFCGGCASIISGSSQPVAFDSTPNRADVYINGAKVCVTPCVTAVQRSKMPPKVEIKKEGYEDANVSIMSKLNPWVIGNVLSGYSSTTGFLVDFIANNGGASVEYEPSRYFTPLEPIEGKKESRSHLLRFVVVNHDEILLDISRGSGEYLSVLYTLTGVEEGNESATFSKLKNLSMEHESPADFAGAVAANL